jgi:inorganic triphosphatase YgiF
MEIELKLRIEPDKIAKIRRSRWWRELGPVRRQSLHSIYFDTGDQQLRDCDVSLRTRTDGHEIVQTVKMLNGGSASVAPGMGDVCSRPDPGPVPGH